MDGAVDKGRPGWLEGLGETSGDREALARARAQRPRLASHFCELSDMLLLSVCMQEQLSQRVVGCVPSRRPNCVDNRRIVRTHVQKQTQAARPAAR